jgi:hypothetical protein
LFLIKEPSDKNHFGSSPSGDRRLISFFGFKGTYSKYNSLDDRIDGFQEIRNRHLTREEGVALVHRFDGEYPERYFDEVMEYVGMDRERFLKICDGFRSPHLWEKENGEWKLKHRVS